jgi:hypothetical protein
MSKAPFSPNTLVDELVWLATQLGCVGNMLDNNHFMIVSKYNHALDAIMARVQTRHEIAALPDAFLSYLGFVEFSVKIGIIFNETFMMRGSVINKMNIDHYQTLMSSTLEYFETWRTRQLQLRTLDDKEWKRKFLSPITSTSKDWNCWLLQLCTYCSE